MRCPFSSVVERVTRNDEVGCSIQPVGMDGFLLVPVSPVPEERDVSTFVATILETIVYKVIVLSCLHAHRDTHWHLRSEDAGSACG
jgi:hypothetical protein